MIKKITSDRCPKCDKICHKTTGDFGTIYAIALYYCYECRVNWEVKFKLTEVEKVIV